ncbi:MAG TPA: hypothetical protein VMT20_22780 [Terriglobia bacterium]|nr:hypothetical protein [Terriglobia bacterium]
MNENPSDAAGPGVFGSSKGTGVWGKSETWMGVFGETTSTTGGAGVFGESATGEGVRGVSHSTHGGVVGVNDAKPSPLHPPEHPFTGGPGVFGQSEGTGELGGGVIGINKHLGDAAGPGVFGKSSGTGVWGFSETWMGVFGITNSTTGGAGVFGKSDSGEGVRGESASTQHGAVVGVNTNAAGVGVYGKGGRLAALFEGHVEVTGDIRLANAGDCAEDFDIAAADSVEPGTVMVLGEQGSLHQGRQAYDKRVAGVISGAGNFKPGIVLDKQESQLNRKPLALLGKVYCKVDAGYAPIQVGDLLTTSPTPGHAMKADDPLRAFGSVIGKALRPLPSGQGLIPILIALQ